MKCLICAVTMFVFFVSGCDCGSESEMSDEGARDYAVLKIVVRDDTDAIKIEKIVRVPTSNYVPKLEYNQGMHVLRWYEGWNGGGTCVLKEGWSANWEEVSIDKDKTKKTVATSGMPAKSRIKFRPTPEEPYPGAPSWRGQ